jgi:sodium/hydrogen antiporter
MNQPDLFTLACVIVGLVLIAMTMGRSYINRLPLSAGMLYLGVGIAIGPSGHGAWACCALTPSRMPS